MTMYMLWIWYIHIVHFNNNCQPHVGTRVKVGGTRNFLTLPMIWACAFSITKNRSQNEDHHMTVSIITDENPKPSVLYELTWLDLLRYVPMISPFTILNNRTGKYMWGLWCLFTFKAVNKTFDQQTLPSFPQQNPTHWKKIDPNVQLNQTLFFPKYVYEHVNLCFTRQHYRTPSSTSGCSKYNMVHLQLNI